MTFLTIRRNHVDKPTEYKLASEILSDILIVRAALRSHLYIPMRFDNRWDATNLKSRLELINNNVDDYNELHNLSEKIETRNLFLNSHIGKEINENDLKKINQETLDACERCLFGIDWTKYK